MTEELFRQDAYLKSCEATVTAVDGTSISLDRTVFYPVGGGQPGDSGTLTTADGRTVRIADTAKDKASGASLHVAEDEAHGLKVGDRVTAAIDWDRRYRFMRMHTCMHLLLSVIDGDVTGGQIGDGKGRVDFNLPDTKLDKEAIGEALNRLIAEDHPTSARWITDDELAAQPELIRTMSVKPPTGAGTVRLMEIAGVDLQPCGGTHVARTSEIGPVRVGKIENKGRQNRRVNLHFQD
ncbi:MAG: alanyl-tRNA editing protein [Alphaproteobacteria bacterium]